MVKFYAGVVTLVKMKRAGVVKLNRAGVTDEPISGIRAGGRVALFQFFLWFYGYRVKGLQSSYNTILLLA